MKKHQIQQLKFVVNRPAEPAAPAAEAPKAAEEACSSNYTPKNNTGTTQSEDDAVDAAIAAAMPALKLIQHSK